VSGLAQIAGIAGIRKEFCRCGICNMIRDSKKLTVQPAGTIAAQISKTSSKNQAAIQCERGACHDIMITAAVILRRLQSFFF
jgi:hypothetical protein